MIGGANKLVEDDPNNFSGPRSALRARASGAGFTEESMREVRVSFSARGRRAPLLVLEQSSMGDTLFSVGDTLFSVGDTLFSVGHTQFMHTSESRRKQEHKQTTQQTR